MTGAYTQRCGEESHRVRVLPQLPLGLVNTGSVFVRKQEASVTE